MCLVFLVLVFANCCASIVWLDYFCIYKLVPRDDMLIYSEN